MRDYRPDTRLWLYIGLGCLSLALFACGLVGVLLK